MVHITIRRWNLRSLHLKIVCLRFLTVFIIILISSLFYPVSAASARRYYYINPEGLGGRLRALSRRYKSLINFHRENCTLTKKCKVMTVDIGTGHDENGKKVLSKPEVLIVVTNRLGHTVGYELLRVLAEGYRKDMWLRKLVGGRKITVVFSVEGGIEVSGFGVGCKMRSGTKRTVENILNKGLVRILVVFKEGGSAGKGTEDGKDGFEIGYTGGSDDIAAEQVAQHLATFAGAFERKSYVVRRFAEPENEGESDGLSLSRWAYLGSSSQNVAQCAKSFNETDTMNAPNNVTHRALSFVVGMSSNGPQNQLGNSAGLYEKSPSLGNGLIPMNIRAALLAIDVAEPYVFFLTHENGTPGVLLSGSILRAKWSVGGAFEIASTYLECVLEDGTKFTTAEQRGGSMWGVNHGVQGYEDRFVQTDGIWLGFRRERIAKWAYSDYVLLIKKLPAAAASQGTILTVRAVAQVDKHWENISLSEHGSHLRPRSHLVRSRLDESWYAKNGKSIIQGKLHFYSAPVTIEVPPLSGWYAIVDYAWELVSIAMLICVVPPGVLILYWRNRGTVSSRGRAVVGITRQRIRKSLRRMFSRGDLKEEVRLINSERRRSFNPLQRNWRQ